MGKPHCTKCGRALTDPFSIAIGMGPECRGRLSKKGWRFPKPRFRVHQGRVVLVGMVGKMEPPPVNVEPKPNKKKEGKDVNDECED